MVVSIHFVDLVKTTTMKKLLLVLSFLPIGISYGQCNDKVMEAFGGTSSISLYNTYITIGAIADGYIAETYDAERVQGLMEEQISMYDVILEQLNAVKKESKSGLSEGDKEYLDEIIECWSTLRNEAKGLKEYAEGLEEGNDLYNTSRDAAWAMIEEIMGLNEEE